MNRWQWNYTTFDVEIESPISVLFKQHCRWPSYFGFQILNRILLSSQPLFLVMTFICCYLHPQFKHQSFVSTVQQTINLYTLSFLHYFCFVFFHYFCFVKLKNNNINLMSAVSMQVQTRNSCTLLKRSNIEAWPKGNCNWRR